MDLETLKPTQVFDSYWKFAAERQRIFFSRLTGNPAPWTEDSIIQQYRFTNAYRASDRASQYLIRNVIYRDGASSDTDTLFRIILFKLFNRIETWEFLEERVGKICVNTFDTELYDQFLQSRIVNGERIYSPAYIMPSGITSFGFKRKHQNHLELIQMMINDGLAEKISTLDSLESLYLKLLEYPMLGKFLAYQLSIDINYSTLCDFDEDDFVVAGPGAINGINKCFANAKAMPYEKIIALVKESQGEEFSARGIEFQNLFGRDLKLIDCQNLFCEIDKYSRVAFGSQSADGRKRIKRKYQHEDLPPINFFFPPKWGINEKVDDFVKSSKKVKQG